MPIGIAASFRLAGPRKEKKKKKLGGARMEPPPPPPPPSGTTVTQRDQWTVEQEVGRIYSFFAQLPPAAQSFALEVQRDNHIEYLTRGLRGLAPSFGSLDASRPWICYWIIHSLALLGEPIDAELEDSIIDFLSRCQDPSGGYGGGPGQLPHLATTYAAVNSLITLGGSRSLSSINRDKVHNFLRQMKQPSGGFRMHDGGEIDVRACYTAISVASTLNILDDELAEKVGDFILRSVKVDLTWNRWGLLNFIISAPVSCLTVCLLSWPIDSKVDTSLFHVLALAFLPPFLNVMLSEIC